jgi:glycosyltransferase involved in cell wall biosynthesis
MRVAHFRQEFSTSSETFIYDYVSEMQRQGVDTHVVTLRRVNEESRPFPNVTVVERPSRWHPRRLWHRALVPFGERKPLHAEWPQIRDRLEEALREIQPDVIHAHFGPAGVIMGPVANRLGVPLVATFYGYDISSLSRESYWREKYDTLWSTVQAVTVLSEEMKEKAVQQGCPTEKLDVVHLSRDLDAFPFRPPTRPVRNLLFVGRFVAKKAPIDAVQAVQEANSRGVDLHLDMAGDGPLLEETRDYIEAEGLSDRVSLHGRVPSDEVKDWMWDSDAFLLPSKTAPNGDREGTPTVLVEAQAVGLPCVATRHAGIPEMIPGTSHELLAPEGNVGALAGSLCRLATLSSDELTRIGRRGRKKVGQDFNLSGEVESLRRIYRSFVRAAVSYGSG